MSQLEMGKLVKCAPSGHLYFDNTKPYYRVFHDYFMKLGGMTTTISKQIGWED